MPPKSGQKEKAPNKTGSAQNPPPQVKLNGKKANPEHIYTEGGNRPKDPKNSEGPELKQSLSPDGGFLENATFSSEEKSLSQADGPFGNTGHECTGCGLCAKGATIKEIGSSSPDLSEGSHFSTSVTPLNNANSPASQEHIEPNAGSISPELAEGSHFSTSVAAMEDTPLDTGHECTGCGLCAKGVTIKEIGSSSPDLSEGSHFSTSVTPPNNANPPASQEDIGSKAAEGTNTIPKEHSQLKIDDLQEAKFLFSPHEPGSGPTTEKQENQISCASLSDIAPPAKTALHKSELKVPLTMEKASTPIVPSGQKQEPKEESVFLANKNAKPGPTNKPKETKSHAPKKRYIIGTYTYEDILATGWLRKLYGHLVGLPAPEERTKKKDTENSQSKKTPKTPKTPEKKKKGNAEPLRANVPKTAKKEKSANKKSKSNIPKTANSKARKKKTAKVQKEMAKTTQKQKELKKKSRSIEDSLRKLKKQKKLAKKDKVKKQLTLEIKKLRLQKSKINAQLNLVEKKLESLKHSLIALRAKELLGKTGAKARLILEKLKQGKPISLLTLKRASKKELKELKKLLENNKIVHYLLLHPQGKKRKSMLLRKISTLLKALGGILGGR